MEQVSTRRSPLEFVVTHRLVFSIALPMMLAFVTEPLIGLVDTTVVGQFGDAALLGGLAAGAIVFDLIFGTFNFLRAATTGLVAQSFGADDEPEQRNILVRALVLAAFSGLVMILASPLISSAAVRFIAAEPAVSSAMVSYIAIRILAAPFALCNYAILGYFLGRGEGAAGLGFQLLVNGLNVVLSIWLAIWLDWGLAGVAWGSVIAAMTATLVASALILTRWGYRLPDLAAVTNITAIRRVMVLNTDIMIRSFCLVGAFALFTRQGAQFSTETLAANAILMNFFLIGGYVLDGFATAAEQFAGRAVGARNVGAFRRSVWLASFWGFVFAGILAIAFLLGGPGLINFMTTAPEVRVVAASFLVWAALTPVTGVLAFQMDGVFIGATWSRDMRNMMLLSLALFVVASWSLIPLMANHGLWLSLHIFLGFRGVTLLYRMNRHLAGGLVSA
jgi:putative MATE family efflux protein